MMRLIQLWTHVRCTRWHILVVSSRIFSIDTSRQRIYAHHESLSSVHWFFFLEHSRIALCLFRSCFKGLVAINTIGFSLWSSHPCVTGREFKDSKRILEEKLLKVKSEERRKCAKHDVVASHQFSIARLFVRWFVQTAWKGKKAYNDGRIGRMQFGFGEKQRRRESNPRRSRSFVSVLATPTFSQACSDNCNLLPRRVAPCRAAVLEPTYAHW